MARFNNLQETNRDLLFDIVPFLSGDTIDYSNEEFFQIKRTNKKPLGIQKWHVYPNRYIENEVRGFFQYLILEKQHSVHYLHERVSTWDKTWSQFVWEKHPEMVSIVDYDFEMIFCEYSNWLDENGYKTYRKQLIPQVDKNMEWVEFNTRSTNLYMISQFYKYIETIVYPDTREEREKDVWDVRNLGVPYHTLPSRRRFTINYTCISQFWLREQVKEFNYFRVQTREMSTILDDMKAFRLFSEFLDLRQPQVQSLLDLNRTVIEDYIAYIREKGWARSTFNRRISAIRTFLTIGNLLNMPGFPVKPLFFDSDYIKVIHKLPVPFSDDELRQLNEHIEDMPIVFARVFFVLENCGMRMSDICCSTILVNGKDCLEKYGEDKYVFTYAMPKVHRSNSIPVSSLVAEVIRSAIEDSKSQCGDDCIYIFSKTKDKPVGEEDFVMNMNRVCKRHNILADDGKILRVKGHTFRRTKATEYANMGISMEVIRMMLGQKKIGVLKHYITIHSQTMIDALRPITDSDDQMIRNIGNEPQNIINENEESNLLPLSHGYCAKKVASGLCDHAYACYSCRMYRPSKKHLYIYRKHYAEAERNVRIAEMNGYDRLLQINLDLMKQLKRIIKKVEE